MKLPRQRFGKLAVSMKASDLARLLLLPSTLMVIPPASLRGRMIFPYHSQTMFIIPEHADKHCFVLLIYSFPVAFAFFIFTALQHAKETSFKGCSSPGKSIDARTVKLSKQNEARSFPLAQHKLHKPFLQALQAYQAAEEEFRQAAGRQSQAEEMVRFTRQFSIPKLLHMSIVSQLAFCKKEHHLHAFSCACHTYFAVYLEGSKTTSDAGSKYKTGGQLGRSPQQGCLQAQYFKTLWCRQLESFLADAAICPFQVLSCRAFWWAGSVALAITYLQCEECKVCDAVSNKHRVMSCSVLMSTP